MAKTIRSEDPTRARSLLESNLRADPGGASATLTEMLIAGEGGPADAKRAVRLLQTSTDAPIVRGILGRLYLDGKFAQRDVKKGIDLIRGLSVWDYDAKLELLRLLASHPDNPIERSDGIICEST